jgi:hypothetical protein
MAQQATTQLIRRARYKRVGSRELSILSDGPVLKRRPGRDLSYTTITVPIDGSLRAIFSHLSLPDLAAAALVCRHWRTLIQADDIWLRKYHVPRLEKMRIELSWRARSVFVKKHPLQPLPCGIVRRATQCQPVYFEPGRERFHMVSSPVNAVGSVKQVEDYSWSGELVAVRAVLGDQFRTLSQRVVGFEGLRALIYSSGLSRFEREVRLQYLPSEPNLTTDCFDTVLYRTNQHMLPQVCIVQGQDVEHRSIIDDVDNSDANEYLRDRDHNLFSFNRDIAIMGHTDGRCNAIINSRTQTMQRLKFSTHNLGHVFKHKDNDCLYYQGFGAMWNPAGQVASHWPFVYKCDLEGQVTQITEFTYGSSFMTSVDRDILAGCTDRGVFLWDTRTAEPTFHSIRQFPRGFIRYNVISSPERSIFALESGGKCQLLAMDWRISRGRFIDYYTDVDDSYNPITRNLYLHHLDWSPSQREVIMVSRAGEIRSITI